MRKYPPHIPGFEDARGPEEYRLFVQAKKGQKTDSHLEFPEKNRALSTPKLDLSETWVSFWPPEL